MAVACCCQEKRFGLKNKMHKPPTARARKPRGVLTAKTTGKKYQPTLHAVLAEQVTRVAVLVMLSWLPRRLLRNIRAERRNWRISRGRPIPERIPVILPGSSSVVRSIEGIDRGPALRWLWLPCLRSQVLRGQESGATNKRVELQRRQFPGQTNAQAQRNTTTHPRMRNGRFPRRANLRFWKYWPFEKRIAVAFGCSVFQGLGANSAEVRSKRDRDARKWWMLSFPGVSSRIQPLHAIGDVKRFVKGGGKGRIGREQPRRSNNYQQQQPGNVTSTKSGFGSVSQGS